MNADTFEFLFGPVDPTLMEDTDDYFYNENGQPHYYKIVLDDDQFYIHDTCNRMMPVDRGFVRSMNTAMFAVTQIYQADQDAQDLFERKYRETMQLLDFWNEQAQQ